ncbi:hypothetical protein SPBR_00792 [Sporothrix brasiliensis 5110]|uniref:Aminoglycoside phosphotransferase domain-containing protein n=1 Tax=Sporothrix brasiliensis 5110 TaxID=1398154 RepID=A0A0C2J0T7_9PEZI|nr:uncharacterized protein SPBR_00792 [Sporothrix brasiliensis 5110]KIH90767.1 hypothetical protein SPBR_00792 [Sporothrix brasiliensis 5110]
MDYVEGKNIRQLGFAADDQHWVATPGRTGKRREALYRGLAHIYTELRKLEFPRIGALGFDPGDSSIQVRHRPINIEVLLQECEGLAPTARLPPGTTFAGASQYLDTLLWLGDNLLEKGRNAVDGRRNLLLYAFAAYRQYLTSKWMDPALETGPFVLMHGDLAIQNLLWDDDMNLVAVLDWEWSSVVPVQFLVPPLWIINHDFRFLCLTYPDHMQEMRKLNAILDKMDTQLDWSQQEKRCDALVLRGLSHAEYVYDTFWSHLSYSEAGCLRFPRGDEEYAQYEETVDGWLEEFDTDERREFVERKKKEAFEYYDEEEAYFGPPPSNADDSILTPEEEALASRYPALVEYRRAVKASMRR